jgi:2-dehydro-3-deoxygluconokinase
MTHVVCFGEMLLRLSPPAHERFFQSPMLRTWFGGCEANVAVGLAHLGTPSAYVTRLPDNVIGDAAVAALRGEGVDTRHVLRGGQRMGIYYVEPGSDLRPMRVVYDRAGSAFSELQTDWIAWPEVLHDAEWLHLSGITPALGAGPAAAVLTAAQAARRTGVRVSLDLNYRPALWGSRDPRPLVAPLAAASDLLIGNPAAFAAMLGVDEASRSEETRGGVEAAVRRMHDDLGCARIAVTRREVRSATEHGWSAFLFDASDGDGRLAVSRRYDVRVVDRIGGGDSFAAGLLHALRAGRDADAALEFATAASALKLTIPGDFNRVSEAEVDRLVESTS